MNGSIVWTNVIDYYFMPQVDACMHCNCVCLLLYFQSAGNYLHSPWEAYPQRPYKTIIKPPAISTFPPISWQGANPSCPLHLAVTSLPPRKMARPVTGLVGRKTSSTGRCKLKPLPNAFEGLVISASGKIPAYEHGKTDSAVLALHEGSWHWVQFTDEIEKMVEKCGAKFEKLKVSDCTHLITTPECYYSEKTPAKSECLKTASVTVGLVKLLMTKFRTSVTEAQRNPNCNIISIDWLLGSIKKKSHSTREASWSGRWVRSDWYPQPLVATPKPTQLQTSSASQLPSQVMKRADVQDLKEQGPCQSWQAFASGWSGKPRRSR